MFCANADFAAYLAKLSAAAEQPIDSFAEMLTALEKRLQYFQQITGTTVSDDGIPYFNWADYTPAEV